MACANSATLRAPQRNNACDGTANRETYLLWADLAANEVLRAVDANLVAASGTSIVYNTNAVGGQAPVPPPVPGATCDSYISWNRISSGTDATMTMPNFRLTSTALSSGWFLSNPGSSQQPAAGQSVLIAQLTLQGQAGPCVEGPKISGTLNLITNGMRQNPLSVCVGSGCTLQTRCELLSGYVVPSMQQPDAGASPVMAAQLVRAAAAPIPLDMATGGFALPSLARSAVVGLAPAAAGQLRRTVLQISYLTDGSESRVMANVSQTRPLLVTVVRPLSGNAGQCTPASALGTVRDRRYSATSYVASLSNGNIVLSLAPIASVAIDISALPNSFDHCGLIDSLVTQARGVNPADYPQRIHLLSFSSICGRVASTLGSAPGLGGWSVYSDAAGCESVDAVAHGLLHQFGLQSSDAFSEAQNTLYSHGDGACMLGRTPVAEGVQRRSLNALQLYLWGALPASRVLAAGLNPNIRLLYSASYPGPEPVVQLIDLALGYFIAYRSASDPGIDRQANFAQAAPSGNPLGLPSYTGRVLIYRRSADQRAILMGSMGLNDRATPGGVITVQVAFLDRYFAQLMISLPSPPLPPAPAPIPDAGRAFVDALPADTAMQSSYLHSAQQSYNDGPLLNLGVNGNDFDPNVFVRLAVPLPRGVQIATAELLLETNSRQLQATSGTLLLEVSAEQTDNSSPLFPGSNLLTRDWGTVRSIVTVSASQYWHDEVVLDVSQLLQQVVGRAGWSPNQFVTFRIHTSGGASSANRVVYAGDDCGANNGGGGAYPCGPRLQVVYVQAGAALPSTTTTKATVGLSTTAATAATTTTTTTTRTSTTTATTATSAPTSTTSTRTSTTTATSAPTSTTSTRTRTSTATSAPTSTTSTRTSTTTATSAPTSTTSTRTRTSTATSAPTSTTRTTTAASATTTTGTTLRSSLSSTWSSTSGWSTTTPFGGKGSLKTSAAAATTTTAGTTTPSGGSSPPLLLEGGASASATAVAPFAALLLGAIALLLL